MSTPPRPIAPGDIVVGYSEELGEWTAAQITDVQHEHKLVAVLELTWSGPEPAGLDDLGELTPLRLTHRNHGQALPEIERFVEAAVGIRGEIAGKGRVQHVWHVWTLPRGHRVLGTRPLLHQTARFPQPGSSFAHQWRLGAALDLQRQRDAGNHGEPVIRVPSAKHTPADLPTTPQPHVRSLTVRSLDALDCALLPALFPNLTTLRLSGDLGTLTNAAALRSLNQLRELSLWEVFGMTAADAVLPAHLPDLAWLDLDGIPVDYAAAMRKAWKPEQANGTHVSVRKARKPDWVAENRDNPLRDWDGREHIPAAALTRAVKQYKTTRRAVLAALADGAGTERLVQLGEEFGAAFNAMNERRPIVETEERQELLDALEGLVEAPWAREALLKGLEAVRRGW